MADAAWEGHPVSCEECLQRAAPLFSWQISVFYLRSYVAPQMSTCVSMLRGICCTHVSPVGETAHGPSIPHNHFIYWRAEYEILVSISPGRVAFRNLSILKVDSSIRAAPMHMHRPRTGAVPTLIYIWTTRSLQYTRVARAAQTDHRTSQQAAILQYDVGPSGVACSSLTDFMGEPSSLESTLNMFTRPLMI